MQAAEFEATHVIGKDKFRPLKQNGYGKFSLLALGKTSWQANVFEKQCAGCHTTAVNPQTGEFETDAVMLHYSTEGGHLQRLIAQGTGGCPLVRINGRDLPLSAKSTTDTLLIHGSDWLSLSARKPLPSAIAKCGAAFARQ